MPNGKKQSSEPECKKQFNRTVAKTGKWRGKTPDKYIKYQSPKRNKVITLMGNDKGISSREQKKIYKEFQFKKKKKHDKEEDM